MAAIVRKDQRSSHKKKKEARYCQICHNNKGMVHKYHVDLCRRCFKDYAEKMGFKKLS